MEVDQGPNWGCSAKEKKIHSVDGEDEIYLPVEFEVIYNIFLFIS
jgi:hypothetical protein